MVAKVPFLDASLRSASRFRRDFDHVGAGGFVYAFEGEAFAWSKRLSDPHIVMPGALAIDESGEVFSADGGDAYFGALSWSQACPF